MELARQSQSVAVKFRCHGERPSGNYSSPWICYAATNQPLVFAARSIPSLQSNLWSFELHGVLHFEPGLTIWRTFFGRHDPEAFRLASFCETEEHNPNCCTLHVCFHSEAPTQLIRRALSRKDQRKLARLGLCDAQRSVVRLVGFAPEKADRDQSDAEYEAYPSVIYRKPVETAFVRSGYNLVA